jgi:hypothetical protein
MCSCTLLCFSFNLEFSCEAEYLPGTLSSGRIQLSRTLGLLFIPFAKKSRPFHIEVCMYIVLGNAFSLLLHQPFISLLFFGGIILMLKSLMLPPYPSLEQFFLLKFPKSDSGLYFAATCLINGYEICHKE